MVLQSPNSHPQQLPPSYKSLYMALFSCVNDTIAICVVGQGYSQTKRKGSKWPMNDQIRRRRHTGTHDQGSEVRAHRVRSLMEAKEKKKTSFPVKFCALDSTFRALRAVAYTSEVQQRAGGFLQLLIQLWLDLASRPLADGPLDGGWTSRGQLDAPFVPEVGVLVAVEALAAGAAGLPAVAAPFVQGGEGRGG